MGKKKITKQVVEVRHSQQPTMIPGPGGHETYYWCFRGLRRNNTTNHLVQKRDDQLSGMALCGVKHPRQIWVIDGGTLPTQPKHNCRNCQKLLELERTKAYGKKVVEPSGGSMRLPGTGPTPKLSRGSQKPVVTPAGLVMPSNLKPEVSKLFADNFGAMTKAELQKVVSYLYSLLDDIDTAADAAKGNDQLYRDLVYRAVGKSKAVVRHCDGIGVAFQPAPTGNGVKAPPLTPSDKEWWDREVWHIIESLVYVCHGIAVQHGFWDTERNPGECIALMHSELSEALEEMRSGFDPEKVAEELADVLIRIFDYCGGAQLDLGTAVVNKIEKNRTRPFKHGKKF